MKLYKFQFLLLILFAVPMMSCENEIIPHATTQEIIQNISRTWSCDMTEDGSSIGRFDIVISPNLDNTKINISNFHKSGEVVIATVSPDLIFDFDYEVGNQVFKGVGEISNDYSRISWDYTIDNGGEDLIKVKGTSTSGEAI